MVCTPITWLRSSVIQCGVVPAPVAPSQMIISPVFGSREIFDQSEHCSPMRGPLAAGGGVVVGAGGGLDGGGGGIGAGGLGDKLAGGVATGAGDEGAVVTGRSCCR